MKYQLLFLMFLIIISKAFSQHGHSEKLSKDTIVYKNVRQALEVGNFTLHGRNFFMTTLNQGNLPDYYANGIGAGLHYLSGSFHGFRFGMGGFFIFNLFSSDLYHPEEKYDTHNRYEIGLFDIEHPTNKNDLDRLEEIYLSYNSKKLSAMIGRLELETPYINAQDFRMRPSVEEGVWLRVKPSEKLSFHAGWLWAMSPRSTVEFFSVAHSIGLYPGGVNIHGEHSEYAGQQHTAGIALLQGVYKPIPRIEILVFNQFVENIFNTSMAQIEYEPEDNGWHAGIQVHFQNKINHGGNPDEVLTYYESDKTFVASAKIGYQILQHRLSLNYTYISNEGRYLMPREWGHEPFYTFMPRERNEGFGGLNAASILLNSEWKEDNFSTQLGYGYYSLPDVKNYRLNKYGLPSYHQINFNLIYHFHKALEGLHCQVLLAGKINQEETYDQEKYILNKVNMLNGSFVVNYYFRNKKSKEEKPEGNH